jgi:hypothetical protein
MSFRGPPVSSSGSVVSSREAAGSDFLRSRIRTTFTVIRCNQVEKADSPRKVPILRKELQECFLHQVFGVGWISDHAQAQGVNAAAVHLVEKLKSRSVSRLSEADGLRFAQRNRLADSLLGLGWSFLGQQSNKRRIQTLGCTMSPIKLSFKVLGLEDKP